MRMQRRAVLAAVLIAVGGLGAACGGSDDASPGTAVAGPGISASAESTLHLPPPDESVPEESEAIELSPEAGGGAGVGRAAPRDASTEDFCEAFSKSYDLEGTEGAEEVGQQLAATGTPADITAEVREGFEIYVDLLSSSDLDEAAAGLAGDAEQKVTAFATWAALECVDHIVGG